MTRTPVVLNFDNSAGAISGACDIDLHPAQDEIRFGCTWRQFHALGHRLDSLLPERYGCVFTGSGDYHHLSWLLLNRLPASQPVQLIICDNHPDNMRYPFGIHCGSWVYWASRLPQVAEIHVVGISSGDIGASHAWENHWQPLRRGKLTYWSIHQPALWTRWTGRRDAARNFNNAQTLLTELYKKMGPWPIYLSIDKDVLSPEVVSTNWDQGHFVEADLSALISRCAGKLIGADITGDVSLWHYQSWFKRKLSAADGQEPPSEQQLHRWQVGQQALNLRLLDAINQAWRPDEDSV